MAQARRSPRPARDSPGDLRARPVHRGCLRGYPGHSVSPGVIETEMATPQAQEFARHAALGRLGGPDEIAAAVSWLVSPEASYVTGSDISVSGGL